ncbi:MAG: DUF4837 family protein [Bacteroidales bacterium]
MKNTTLIFLLVSLMLMASCKMEDGKSLMPNVTGKPGEVVLVINGEQWTNTVGESYRHQLQHIHPLLPQDEPLFDLVHIPYSAFTKIFKTHRNIILAKIDKSYEEPRILIQRDTWAKPQLVVNVLAKNDSAMAQLLREKGHILVEKVLETERERYLTQYKNYSNKGAVERLKRKFGATIAVPDGYSLDVDTTNFAWIAYEKPDMFQGVFMYTYPYKEDMTMHARLKKRTEFTKQFVPGEAADSYMDVELKYATPSQRKVKFQGKTFTEIRGLWRVENDYMGGPFINLSYVDTANNRVVVADGFVFAPRGDKRNYLRQVEAILYSLQTTR